MAWLYHLQPDTLKGNTLYPLSQLKQHHPEQYEEERAKYERREQVLTRTIPPLDCEWQDVLQFTAVHPAEK